ncbi:hypothetical protein IPM09_01845 [Candidatus Saccharibacteria bacterium]|nr:MAG: hypothetical protein IPM09_01845 [Candidatus Saccharibacteria bacterium]
MNNRPASQSAQLVDNDHAIQDLNNENLIAQTQNELVIEKKKRRSKPLLVVVLALLLVALGGVATLLLYKQYFEKQPIPTQTTSSSTSPVSSKKLTAADTINAVNEILRGTVENESTAMLQPLKVAGYDFYTGIDRNKIVSIAQSVPANDAPVMRAKITKLLKEKGFSDSTLNSVDDMETSTIRYAEADVVCSLLDTKTYNNPAGPHQFVIGCGNMSDYVSTAKAQSPFYGIYPNKSDVDATVLFNGIPVVKASSTQGYQTAQIGVSGVMDGQIGMGGFAGLFYQTPDKVWHYFTGTQGLIPCSDYAGSDIKKAYFGTDCSSADGKTTQKVSL